MSSSALIHEVAADRRAGIGAPLDVYPSFALLLERLREEADPLDRYLLAAAVADTVDDYLSGVGYDFSKASALLPGLAPLWRGVEKLLRRLAGLRRVRLTRLERWRDEWKTALDACAETLSGTRPDAIPWPGGRRVAFSKALLAARAHVPAAFRSQDLTHHDVLALAGRFEPAEPSRSVLIVGLRTAGSYFAPLAALALRQRGFENVDWITLRPKHAAAPREAEALQRAARAGALAVLIDEPVNQGTALGKAVGRLLEAGFARSKICALLPLHPHHPDWRGALENSGLGWLPVTTLPAEDWYKVRQLDCIPAGNTLQELLEPQGWTVLKTMRLRQAEAELAALSDQRFHSRLKAVYAVRVRNRSGQSSTRFILAKSVGWGWYGAAAWAVVEVLREFVPPVLGLHEGILYSEWLTPGTTDDRLVQTGAEYVARRARSLPLPSDPEPQLAQDHRHGGCEDLAARLAGAYGGRLWAALARRSIELRLAEDRCPCPALIDGKLRPREWLDYGGTLVKTDFEQHGLGKTELNVTDPAYDLADLTLHARLDPAQEKELLERYVGISGDRDVPRRLFRNKLLAGTAALSAALDGLSDARLRHRHAEFHQLYQMAWNFLVAQTTRLAATSAGEPGRTQSAFVVLDVDGVLDRQVFGYPSATWASIQAVACLHAHGYPILLDTARSLRETQEYCRAYGFRGGGAEYGSVVWGTAGGYRDLVAPESREQLDLLRDRLDRLPGVFLDPWYTYSVRAFTYNGGTTVPLPPALMPALAGDLHLDRLRWRNTFTDTAVTAREVDKGTGLRALLQLLGEPDAATIAVGDSSADLPMFQAASRCFAPAHIECRSAAALLGCRFAARSYQAGFLEIARRIAHPDGSRCPLCPLPERPPGLVFELLDLADRPAWYRAARVFLNPDVVRAFRL